MSEPDLALCVEAIEKAINYGKEIKELSEQIMWFRERRLKANAYSRVYKVPMNPKETKDDIRAKKSTNGFVEAVKAIADYCPLPEDMRKDLLDKYEDWRRDYWEVVALELLDSKEIESIPSTALEFLRDYEGR